VPARRRVWACHKCQHPFDRNAIEATLVELAYQLAMSAQVQDLKCGRCQAVKASNLELHCPCSGLWKARLSKEEVTRRWEVMSAIGEYHGFDLLVEVTKALRGESVP
jgi:DNA polymerase epsilon subunit 1